MKKFIQIWIMLGIIVSPLIYVGVSQPAEKINTSFFSPLKVGQMCDIEETKSNNYKITVRIGTAIPPTIAYKIVEIGSDYIAVENITGILNWRIPVYSINSISIIDMDKLLKQQK